jgi:hypothetical protein
VLLWGYVRGVAVVAAVLVLVVVLACVIAQVCAFACCFSSFFFLACVCPTDKTNGRIVRQVASRRDLLAATTLVGSLATLGSGFATDFRGLFWTRALAGGAVGVFFVSPLSGALRAAVLAFPFAWAPFGGGLLLLFSARLLCKLTSAAQNSLFPPTARASLSLLVCIHRLPLLMVLLVALPAASKVGGMMPLCLSLLADLYGPEERTVATGLLATVSGIGTGTGQARPRTHAIQIASASYFKKKYSSTVLCCQTIKKMECHSSSKLKNL